VPTSSKRLAYKLQRGFGLGTSHPPLGSALGKKKEIFVHIDNQAAVSIVNKGSCHNPIVMQALRNIFWMSAVYNFRLKAVYYPGRFNRVADSISRLHESGGYARLLNELSTCLF
jgi:hypothetical protein